MPGFPVNPQTRLMPVPFNPRNVVHSDERYTPRTVPAHTHRLAEIRDVSGVTGSGDLVLVTSPTIVTPTIASFVNAQHNHQNAAGGGTLDASAIASGVLAQARVPQAFPVGSVYINVTGVNPATELGYGTWSAFGAGRVLIGQDTGDADFDVLLETGGAKTVASAGSVAAPTISGSTASEAAHTHSVTSNVAVANHSFTQPTFTGNAMGTHAHELPFISVNNTTTRFLNPSVFGTGTSRSPFSTFTTSGNTTAGNVDLSEAVSAGTPTGTNSGGAVDAHSVTNNAVTSGAGSSHLHAAGTLAASAPAFTGSATSVVPPYVVVCFWRRTA